MEVCQPAAQSGENNAQAKPLSALICKAEFLTIPALLDLPVARRHHRDLTLRLDLIRPSHHHRRTIWNKKFDWLRHAKSQDGCPVNHRTESTAQSTTCPLGKGGESRRTYSNRQCISSHLGHKSFSEEHTPLSPAGAWFTGLILVAPSISRSEPYELLALREARLERAGRLLKAFFSRSAMNSSALSLLVCKKETTKRQPLSRF